jgi:hypothetical protein
MGIIRPLEARDLVGCIDLVRQAYGIPYARYAEIELNQALAASAPKPFFIVHATDDLVTGFAGYCPSGLDFAIWSLIWVNTRPGWRRRGIGRVLVQRCLSDMTAIASTAILATTIPDWYERHFGFRRIYEYGGDHTVMCRALGA